MKKTDNIIKVSNNVDVTKMLSSTTYETRDYNKCVYCHKDVENDYFDFKGNYYQPYRCNCHLAKKELEIKEKALEVMVELLDLNKEIVLEDTWRKIEQGQISKINQEFEYDEDEENELNI